MTHSNFDNTKDKKIVIILRGAPGSGKSTWAKNYRDPCLVVSTDNFFIDKTTGIYTFEEEKLGYYHKCALDEFKEAIEKGIPTILLDNTNIKKVYYKKYVEFAKAANYNVVQKTFWGDYKSIHNVDQETIQRMRNTFQNDDDLPHYYLEGGENGAS